MYKLVLKKIVLKFTKNRGITLKIRNKLEFNLRESIFKALGLFQFLIQFNHKIKL